MAAGLRSTPSNKLSLISRSLKNAIRVATFCPSLPSLCSYHGSISEEQRATRAACRSKDVSHCKNAHVISTCGVDPMIHRVLNHLLTMF